MSGGRDEVKKQKSLIVTSRYVSRERENEGDNLGNCFLTCMASLSIAWSQ